MTSNLARQFAHRVLVMRRGEPVGLLPVEALGGGRVYPYTRDLIAATPAPVGCAEEKR